MGNLVIDRDKVMELAARDSEFSKVARELWPDEFALQPGDKCRWSTTRAVYLGESQAVVEAYRRNRGRDPDSGCKIVLLIENGGGFYVGNMISTCIGLTKGW